MILKHFVHQCKYRFQKVNVTQDRFCSENAYSRYCRSIWSPPALKALGKPRLQESGIRNKKIKKTDMSGYDNSTDWGKKSNSEAHFIPWKSSLKTTKNYLILEMSFGAKIQNYFTFLFLKFVLIRLFSRFSNTVKSTVENFQEFRQRK